MTNRRYLRKSIIADPVNPTDLRELDIQYSCEQCSYFDASKNSCLMGFNCELHLRENQKKLYNLSGRMIICRVQEID